MVTIIFLFLFSFFLFLVLRKPFSFFANFSINVNLRRYVKVIVGCLTNVEQQKQSKNNKTQLKCANCLLIKKKVYDFIY